MDEKTTYTLVNPSFTFNFNGKDYQVKKANLEQVVQYQKRLKEVVEAKEPEAKIIPYCIFLILNKVDPEITEAYVSENTPGDMDGIECLVTLGFMNPRQVQMMAGVTKEQNPSTSESSL